MKNELLVDQHFQLWEYRVNHGCLLIRSPKTEAQSFNVDIRFSGVEFLSVSRHLDSLQFCEVTAQDSELVNRLYGKAVDPSRIFVFISAVGRHVVVAASAVIEKSFMDIFESPFE